MAWGHRAAYFPIKAKRIIHLCMAGGPSQFESLDPKPELSKLHKHLPGSYTKGQQLAAPGLETGSDGAICGVQKYRERRRDPDFFEDRLGRRRLCIIRSMLTEQINHDPAHTFMNTGAIVKACELRLPMLGPGAETDDLRGFIVLTSTQRDRRRPTDQRAASAGIYRANSRGGFHLKGRGITRESAGGQSVRARSSRGQSAGMAISPKKDRPEIQTRIAQYEASERACPISPTTAKSRRSRSMAQQPGDGSSNRLLLAVCQERSLYSALSPRLGSSPEYLRICRWPRAMSISDRRADQ